MTSKLSSIHHPNKVELSLVESNDPKVVDPSKVELYSYNKRTGTKGPKFSFSDKNHAERDLKLKILESQLKKLWEKSFEAAAAEANFKGIELSRCEISFSTKEIIYFDKRGTKYTVEEKDRLSLEMVSFLSTAQDLLFSDDIETFDQFHHRYQPFQVAGRRFQLFKNDPNSIEGFERSIKPILTTHLKYSEKDKAEKEIAKMKALIQGIEEKADQEIALLEGSFDSLSEDDKKALQELKHLKERLKTLRYDAVFSAAAFFAICSKVEDLKGVKARLKYFVKSYLKNPKEEGKSWTDSSFWVEGFGKAFSCLKAYWIGKEPQGLENLAQAYLMRDLYVSNAVSLLDSRVEGEDSLGNLERIIVKSFIIRKMCEEKGLDRLIYLEDNFDPEFQESRLFHFVLSIP